MQIEMTEDEGIMIFLYAKNNNHDSYLFLHSNFYFGSFEHRTLQDLSKVVIMPYDVWRPQLNFKI